MGGANPAFQGPTEKDGNKVTSPWWGGSVFFTITQTFWDIENLIVNGVHIDQQHNAIDIAMPIGTALYTPEHAVVKFAGKDPATGANYVSLLMDNGDVVQLWHLNDVAVKVGQDISAGTLLGHSGDTGLSTGPHLHFEVLRGGKPIDPFGWLIEAASSGGTGNPLSDAGNAIATATGLTALGNLANTVNSVLTPQNFWRVAIIGLGGALIVTGVFMYFFKQESAVAVKGAEVAAIA